MRWAVTASTACRGFTPEDTWPWISCNTWSAQQQQQQSTVRVSSCMDRASHMQAVMHWHQTDLPRQQLLQHVDTLPRPCADRPTHCPQHALTPGIRHAAVAAAAAAVVVGRAVHNSHCRSVSCYGVLIFLRGCGCCGPACAARAHVRGLLVAICSAAVVHWGLLQIASEAAVACNNIIQRSKEEMYSRGY